MIHSDKAWLALSNCLKQLSQEILPLALFPHPPILRFIPERDACICGGKLGMQKSRRKKVLSMTGPFIAHEKVLKCADCARTFRSEALLRLVPSRCNVAYDVLVFVGHSLFRRHRTTEEVRNELTARNVRLCASEIDYLGRKFITYLAVAHRQATPRIRQAMTLAGGYILHLDATHEGEAPTLMTGMDSLSQIVLANVKLPGENADYIIPFLQKLQSDYGNPRACVNDMGKGILKAVAKVFPGIQDFICHFHFLRDIGKDFLEPAYSQLRHRLRSHAISSRLHALVREARQQLSEQSPDLQGLVKAIQVDAPWQDMNILSLASPYSLALWCFHGKHCGDGYGFPFDRPLLEFAQRLLELNDRLPEFLKLFSSGGHDGNQLLSKLSREVSDIAKDLKLSQAVEELYWRSQVFDRLRKAMRIAAPDDGNGLNDEGTAEAMSTIRHGVEKFRRYLEKDPKLVDDLLSRKMAKQIDKYGDKLFADPIEVSTPNGTVTLYPQRTNNILEQFFRGMRRGQRRKTGNDSISRVLQTMLADTPLIKNLDNPDYMKVLLDGKASLEELFAELPAMSLISADDSLSDTERILPGFQKLIKLPNLPDQVARLCIRTSTMAKSN